jgi:TolB protein
VFFLSLVLPSLMAFSQTPAVTSETTEAVQAQVQIDVTEAKTRKSLIAFPNLQVSGSSGGSQAAQKAAEEIFRFANDDLKITGFFQLIDAAAFLEDTSKVGIRPFPEDPNGFKFESWKQIGAEILARGQYSVEGGQIQLEIHVYQVTSGNLVLGKKYKGDFKTAKRIAHTFTNDLLAALTGKPGMFLSRIVTSSDRGGNLFKEIYLMDWDGEDPRKLTDHKTISLSPAISKDGQKVAYTAIVQHAKTQSRNIDLYLYDIVSGKRDQVSFREGINSGANFDPDGKHLYATLSQTGTSDIYKISYEGKVITQITKGPRGAMNVEPAISPDGKTIAFSSDRGGNPMIYIMDADGTNVKRVTLAGTNNASPSWSPDGKLLTFSGWNEDHFDIYTVSPDGQNLNLIVKAKKASGKWANNETPVFSPDGRFLMYTSNRTGSNQIFISNLDGTEERRITNDDANYFSPKWSTNIE